MSLVQTLEPAGVGARDLQECLILQLNARPERGRGVGMCMQDRQSHLPMLAAQELGKLQQQVGCDEKTMHQAIALIRSLDPKPGHRFGRGDARFVIPDVIVTKVRGKWMVQPESGRRAAVAASTVRTPTRYRGLGHPS